MLWKYFSSAGTEKMIRADGRIDRAKFRVIPGGNLLLSGKDLRWGHNLPARKDTARAKMTTVYIKRHSLEKPSQSLNI